MTQSKDPGAEDCGRIGSNGGAEDEFQHASPKAMRLALNFISHRARSQAEVRRRLQKRFPAQVTEQVVARLVQQGYLDDAAFAREWRRHREQRSPRGQGIIRRELLAFGVDAEAARDALEGFDPESNAFRAAQNLARRVHGTDYPRFRQRVWGYLQRRGFDHQVIGTVVQQLWRDLSDLLDSGVDAHKQEQDPE